MTPHFNKLAESAPQDWATGRKRQAEVLGFDATVTSYPAQDGGPGCWAVDFDIPASRRAAAIAIDNIEARNFIDRLERGRGNVRILTLEKLALALGTDLTTLLDVSGTEIGHAAR